MMKRQTGKRHPLLFYRRALDPLWQTSLALGALMVVGQQLSGRTLPYLGLTPRLPWPFDELLFVGGLLLAAIGLFFFFARRMAYAQARADHLRLVTPFTTIQVSYRRVRSVHPSSISQIFPPASLRGRRRAFLEPFFGKTAVVVELNGYPLSARAMRFFLGAETLLPNQTGLVLMTPDWLALSTEIDSLYGNWRQGRRRN